MRDETRTNPFSLLVNLISFLFCRRCVVFGARHLQEVGRKSDRITMLEKEKSSLIRELFQARSQNVSSAAVTAINHRPPTSDDNAFM
jgi:hypothetical protein